MIYYTAFFAFTYLFSRLRTRIGRRSIQQSRAFLIGILILLLMGLRDQTVAGDTIVYVWIEREAKKSLLGSRCDIHMIYDWIDTATFYRRETSKIRAMYQIRTDTVILGVSTFWSKDKGQEEMLKISQEMPEATVILVGRQPEDAKYPENVITIPFTDSKDELAELYSVANVFFNPTRQETFGLVSGEALACGTPLVVYNTTACPEFVTEETGVIMEQDTDIVTAVREMLDKNQQLGREFVAEKCREFVEKNFNMDTNIGKYIELFHKKLEEF